MTRLVLVYKRQDLTEACHVERVNFVKREGADDALNREIIKPKSDITTSLHACCRVINFFLR